MMIRRLFFSLLFIAVLFSAACTDNDSFSTSAGNRLSFSEDTIRFDTLFSTVPSTTQAFWVHNHSDDGIRIKTARLERGIQSGYRVNVDGTYLNPVGSDFEVRKGDSLLVFVEVTTRENHAAEPQLVEDNLILTLESGIEQRVNLRTYSWDALKLSNLVISRDTTIESSTPIIVYGDGITVAEGVRLTLRNTDFYFHDGAGIEALGTLVAEGCLFRGDRLDRMFTYLPYDRVPGQWQGITLASHDTQNSLTNCEIRNAIDALVCDSTSLMLVNTVIHNSNGAGLMARNSEVTLSYCQFSNTLDDCLALEGCQAQIDHCTMAQFFPFSADRGAALSFRTTNLPMMLYCSNILVTGYADDVLMGQEHADEPVICDYRFEDCILRTDSVIDAERFMGVIWETPKDSVQGIRHFKTIDEENLYYDFSIDSISPAYRLNIGRILKFD